MPVPLLRKDAQFLQMAGVLRRLNLLGQLESLSKALVCSDCPAEETFVLFDDLEKSNRSCSEAYQIMGVDMMQYLQNQLGGKIRERHGIANFQWKNGTADRKYQFAFGATACAWSIQDSRIL